MQEQLPETIRDFSRKYPQVWDAFAKLGQQCHDGGPLDEKTRRLVKLGVAVAHRHEGAVHSAVRNARASQVTMEEMMHVAVLAITTIGWPAAYAAMTWIDEALKQPTGDRGIGE
jgi:alkylhydroperoxidase/carboxymuconolactone decarboxylase family protein YurZ